MNQFEWEENKDCLICQQPKDAHDSIVCDAVRVVLSNRAKKQEKAA